MWVWWIVGEEFFWVWVLGLNRRRKFAWLRAAVLAGKRRMVYDALQSDGSTEVWCLILVLGRLGQHVHGIRFSFLCRMLDGTGRLFEFELGLYVFRSEKNAGLFEESLKNYEF